MEPKIDLGAEVAYLRVHLVRVGVRGRASVGVRVRG